MGPVEAPLRGGARWLAVLVLLVGVLLVATLVVTTLEGRGPESPWIGIPVVAGAVALVAAPVVALRGARRRRDGEQAGGGGGLLGRVAGVGLGVLLVSVVAGLLLAPEAWVEPAGTSSRAPDSVGEARVLGLLLGVPLLGGAAAWVVIGRRGRARERESEALLRRLRGDS